MCTIHLAAMVHIIYTLTENKTPILLSFFSFTTASLAATCDSKTKLLLDHSRVKSDKCDLFVIESSPDIVSAAKF